MKPDTTPKPLPQPESLGDEMFNTFDPDTLTTLIGGTSTQTSSSTYDGSFDNSFDNEFDSGS